MQVSNIVVLISGLKANWKITSMHLVQTDPSRMFNKINTSMELLLYTSLFYLFIFHFLKKKFYKINIERKTKHTKTNPKSIFSDILFVTIFCENKCT